MLVSDDILTEAEFRQISDMVYRHCGINLHDGKRELVRARLVKLMRLGNFPTVAEYLHHVEQDASGASFTQLIDAISTNLTSFFRENGHFEYLSQQFLPKLLEKRRHAGSHRLRAWSAGCSTGEEPYTLTIVLLEAMGGDAAGWDVRVLATDISTQVLRTAQLGIYDKQRIEPVPPALRTKYLTPNRIEGRQVFQANPRLKQLIAFRHLNLMETWPFSGPFDFIFCRNVMIYFDKPTQQKLVNRYWDVLEPGGLLFTGHSESLTGIEHRFRYVQPTIYLKP